MSRLDELIKELCPNGVEYKKLGEIFNLKMDILLQKLIKNIGKILILIGLE